MSAGLGAVGEAAATAWLERAPAALAAKALGLGREPRPPRVAFRDCETFLRQQTSQPVLARLGAEGLSGG